MICSRCGWDSLEIIHLNPRYCIKCGERMEEKKMVKNIETMNVDQVADFFQLTKGSVYQYVRRGVIPAFKLGRTLRFNKQEMEKLKEIRGN